MTLPRTSPDLTAGKRHLKARHRAITKRLMASIYEAQNDLENLLLDSEVDLPQELPEDAQKLEIGFPTWVIDSWCLTQYAIDQAVAGEVCDTEHEYKIFREQILPELHKRRQFASEAKADEQPCK